MSEKIDTANMMTERARVLSLPVDGLLWVERLPSDCGACNKRMVCVCNLRRAPHHYRTQVRLPEHVAPSGIALNQSVEIGIASGLLLSAALRFYFLPALSLLLGAFLAGMWWDSDAMALVGAVVAMVLVFVLLRPRSNSAKRLDHYPVLLRVLESKDQSSGFEHND